MNVTTVPFSLSFFLTFLLTFQTIGQTGPAGIEATNGTSNLILWLDANQIEDIYDENNISVWEDKSGHHHHASQSVSNGKPNFMTNELNGFPVVRFSGSERLDGSFGASKNSPLTTLVVCYFDQLNQGAGDNDYVFSVGSTSGANNMTNIARRQNDTPADADKYYNYDGATIRFGTALTGQQWTMLTQLNNASATYHELYKDGTSQAVTDFTSTISSDGDFRVADWANSPDNSFYFDGNIAEIIVFDKSINSAERKILHSYLAGKYDLTTSDDQYVGDEVGNGHHDFDIVGIGTEADGSNTTAHSSGIRITQNSNFDNGDYVLLGHKTTTNALNTADAADASAQLDERWERTWWLDITDGGGAMTVDVTFDISEGGLGGTPSATASDYKLLHRTATSGNWTLLATASSVSGDQISFSNVAITTDGYYGLGTIDNTGSTMGSAPASTNAQGPAGVGHNDGASDLELWLDAAKQDGGDGDYVLTFADQSGNGYDATQSNIFNMPLLYTNIVNGQNVIRFNGTSNFLTGTLGGNLAAPSTLFAVTYFSTLNQGAGDNDYVISIGGNTSANEHTSIARRKNDTPADADKYYSWNGTATSIGPVITGQQWDFITQVHATTSQYHSVYVDGASQTISSDYGGSLSGASTTFNLGRWTNGNNWFGGDLAEVILYDRTLNTAELNLVHSYLSAKYNITYAGDKYTGDDAENGSHILDVAGIGKEADGSNTGASSAGLYAAQNSGFDNGDYLMFGHKVSENRVNTDDADDGATLQQRWNRSWWMDVTDASTAMTVDFTFDFSEGGSGVFPGGSANNYKFLYRSGTSGNWTVLASGNSISGDQVNFTNVSMSSDGYFTIGTIDPSASPLPVDLIHFTTQVRGKQVDVNWATASEQDNQGFHVERSSDGIHFEQLAWIPGRGNSSIENLYTYADNAPLPGYSYYRLLQTDINGDTKLYGPLAVYRPENKAEYAYVNPVDQQLYVQLSMDSPEQLRFDLYSETGQLIQSESHVLSPENQRHALSLEGLTSGFYFIQVSKSNGVPCGNFKFTF